MNTPLPTVASIQHAVARRYRIPLAMMRAPDGPKARQRRYAWPRQVAMCLATRLTNHSLNRIGHFFGGRDHSTVIHACEAIEKRRARNPKLSASMRCITLDLVRR